MADQLRSSRRNALQLQDFEVQGVLGEGSYGFVLLAIRNSEEFALKEMSKYRLRKHHNEHVALVEKELLKRMQHPGIATASGAFQTPSKLYIILELCKGGEFSEYSRKGMPQASKRFYFAQLVNILEYLHSNGIVHRDLKPSNLLLTEEGHLKIIDFGTACVQNCALVPNAFRESLKGMKEGEQEDLQQNPKIRKRKSTFVGTSEYMSPELIERNECNCASDIWALGCILYFIYFGGSPFYDPCELVQFKNIRTCNYEIPQNEHVAEEVKDLIGKLLFLTPEERLGSCSREELSFKALKNHPFFHGIDVDSIYSSVPPAFVNPEKEVERRLQNLRQTLPLPSQNGSLSLYLGKRLRNTYKIYRCQFNRDLTMHEYDMDNHQYLPLTYRLTMQDQSLAKVLSPNKFLIKMQNPEGDPRLFYRTISAQADSLTINNFYSMTQQSTLT